MTRVILDTDATAHPRDFSGLSMARRWGAWIALGVALTWSAVAWEARAGLIANSTFESDSVDTGPRTSPLGANPANWSIGGFQRDDAGGIRDANVEAVGSPFDGGSGKSMLIFGNNTATGDPRYEASASIAPASSSEILFQFDIRFNNTTLLPSGDHHWRLFGGGGQGSNFTFSAGVSNVAFNAGGSPTVNLGTLNYNTWYRIQALIPASTIATNEYRVSVTDFPTLTTNFYTAKNRSAFNGSPWTSILFNTNNSTQITDFNLDNVQVTAVPEPPLAILAVTGMLGWMLWRRRRQAKAE